MDLFTFVGASWFHFFAFFFSYNLLIELMEFKVKLTYLLCNNAQTL